MRTSSAQSALPELPFASIGGLSQDRLPSFHLFIEFGHVCGPCTEIGSLFLLITRLVVRDDRLVADLVGDRHALHAVVPGDDGVLEPLAQQDRRLGRGEAASVHLELAAVRLDQALPGFFGRPLLK